MLASRAAHAQQRHLDAFRQAGATAPERAQPLAALGVAADSAFERLTAAGLVRDAGGGRFYLDEVAVIARRGNEPRRAFGVALAVLLVVVLLPIAILVLAQSIRLP